MHNHIRAAARPRSESERLLGELLTSSWPGGTADRVEPYARGWLTLWGPQRTVVELPLCACVLGRCSSCN